MYLKARLRRLPHRSFCEIGAGNGFASHALLTLGMSGVGFDLNASACDNNRRLNQRFIDRGRYRVLNADFLEEQLPNGFDVVMSSMVIEHLTPAEVDRYFRRCKRLLEPGGRIITIVPASQEFWGIEDEIAGHQKRYSPACFDEIAREHGLRIAHLAGLTYPLSNLLLPISNYLVRRGEAEKLRASARDRTIASGNRTVALKTAFPDFFRYLVNEVTLYPFFLLQNALKNHRKAMVLYCELQL